MIVPCPECKKALRFDEGRFHCTTDWCSALGMEMPVWRAVKDSGLAAPTPAGLPRPEHRGLPVPWVAPRTENQVWWRALDAERLALAQNLWLCQACGQALPEKAWVLASPEGQVLQAALHETCKDMALEYCPHLSSGTTRTTPRLIARSQLITDGRPVAQAAPSEPDFLHQWELERFDETG
ncbi:hypothetical protein ACPXCO_23175 [Streptomyces cyaneofuscatus]|uniref:hypothetical protein n=1 Tax=Streptomyces cyaneofuscatus TaxID=66883 RepID=UPI003CF67087